MRINLKVSIFGLILLAAAVMCVSCDEEASRSSGRNAFVPASHGVTPIAPPAQMPPRISPGEAMQHLRSGERITVVDVRNELERDVGGRIPNDINVPLNPRETFAERIQRVVPDRNSTVYLYCQAGLLSSEAGMIMSKMGYTRVYLLGGIDEWPYEKL